MSDHVMMLAKRPRLGRVKTRLLPTLTAEQALDLYRAFLRDQLSFLRDLRSGGLEVELCIDAPWSPPPDLAALLDGLPIGLQGPGDLGERLRRCFRRAFAGGAPSVAAIGVDSPTLPADTVRAAFDTLRSGADVVAAPAADGGYVLLAMGAPHDAVLEGIPWGGADVMDATRQRADAHGLRLVEIDPWYDVDDASGLARLREELASGPLAGNRATATARFLAGLDSD